MCDKPEEHRDVLGTEIQEFVVATANFGGAARAVPAVGGAQCDRSEAVVDFIRAPSGVAAIDCLPSVIGLQEVTRLLKVEPPTSSVDYPHEIVRRLATGGSAVDHYYVPTVTTTQYPLTEKWKPRWDTGIEEMEQGMFVCAHQNATLMAPWLDPLREEKFKGLKLDLPLRACVKEYNWRNGVVRDRFKATYYRGNRDTEPRVATVHGVRAGVTAGAHFVFVNVHLATLRAEDAGTRKLLPTDAEERTIRRATSQGSRLRRLQLGVIRDFLLEVVYGALRLPAIVAGDFNASLDAAEVKAFMDDTFLRGVFDATPDRCWKCGSPSPCDSTPRAYYTFHKRKEILVKTRGEVSALLGHEHPQADASPISVTERCSACEAPFFSHKRNFGLIDNILYTDSDSPGLRRLGPNASLRWQVAIDSRPNTRGIRLDTYFSDHLPLWCKFSIQPSGLLRSSQVP